MSRRKMHAARSFSRLGFERLAPRCMLSGGSAIAISAVFDYTGIGRLNTTTSLYDPAAQPIRGAYVVVFGSGSPALASAYTNDSGAISLSVTPPADNTGFYFVIETASNPQTATGIYRVVMPDRTSMPYSFTTQTFSYDYTAPPQSLNAGTVAIPDTLANLTVDSAFAAFDGLTVAAEYADTLVTAAQMGGADLRLVYPYTPPFDATGLQAGTHYSFSATSHKTVYLVSDQAFSIDTISHEYGHYIADVVGFGNSLTGDLSHSSLQNLRNGALPKSTAVVLALEEGWADYFAVAAEMNTEAGLADAGIPELISNEYDSLESGAFGLNVSFTDGFDLGTDTGRTVSIAGSVVATPQYGLGEDNEVTIARILYALDTGSFMTVGGQVQMPAIGGAGVFNMMVTLKPQSLQNIWSYLVNSVESADDYATLFPYASLFRVFSGICG